MRFKCEFPGCEFETDLRFTIDEHHIVPKEFGGEDKPFNLIKLCPNCHRKIFIENSTGQHSHKTNHSIILKGWKLSSSGRILNYIDEDGKEQFTL